jgi:alkylation response protein AidB-like acyl-CoA dehydrogenase
VPPDRVLAPPGTEGVAEALDRAGQEATVALAASTVGACRVVFERTVEYAMVREQYGRPIGSFQALKHRLADMYLAVERATALCYFAALTIAEEDPRRAEAASMAKAAAGECQALVAQDGLQLHGGIGVTWENDLHFPVKRAITGDALYGNAVHHRARLARMLGLVA